MLIFASLTTLCIAVAWPKHPGLLRVVFLDIGQGDAVLVEAPNGNRLLYDAGPTTHAILPALSRELGYWDGIDVLMASHPDADHIGGFTDVLGRYTPSLYLDGHTFTVSPEFVALEEELAALHIARRTVGDGAVLDLGSGVVVNILAPKQDAAKSLLSTNDSSVIALVRYGSSTVLLTGDLELDGEDKLVAEYGDGLRATVLKAGHHGSKSSTGDALLAATRPEYVVISAGLHNKYGHPHASTVSRILARGAIMPETAKEGDVRFLCSPSDCVRE